MLVTELTVDLHTRFNKSLIMCHQQRTVILEEAKAMLRKGVIQESSSPWAVPLVLVKRDGLWRFCVKCRRLNTVTIKYVDPLP